MDSEAAARVLAMVRGGSLDELDEFLEKEPAAIRSTDRFGNGVLHVASAPRVSAPRRRSGDARRRCHANSKRAVKFALRRGLDVNTRNASGNTSLHYCFAFGHADLAAYLIGKGADDSIRNAEGLTPYEGLRLHDAAEAAAEERVGYFTRAAPG